MAEHFLNTAQVSSSFEQVSGERVAQEVRVDPFWLETCFRGNSAQDQERAGARERSALRIQEQLGSMAAVEVRPPAGEVTTKRFGGAAADRHDPLLRALADAADEASVEVDAALVERDGL